MSLPPARPVPSKLAKIGLAVRQKLRRHARVQTFPAQGLELHFFQNFFSDEECDALMAHIDETSRPSSLYKGTEREGFRTSYTGYLDASKPLVRALDGRICAVMGLDKRHGEPTQGQRYAPGQRFKPHHDFFHTTESYWEGEKARGGQRSWTAMAYLNQPEEGGATYFPTADIRVDPRKAMLVMWNNMSPSGEPNHASLHEGMPVITGTKYIITKWFREGNFK